MASNHIRVHLAIFKQFRTKIEVFFVILFAKMAKCDRGKYKGILGLVKICKHTGGKIAKTIES